METASRLSIIFMALGSLLMSILEIYMPNEYLFIFMIMIHLNWESKYYNKNKITDKERVNLVDLANKIDSRNVTL